MTPVRLVAGLLLVAFLPGFLLIQAAFPRGLPHGRRPGSSASLTLLVSVALSLAVTTLVGLVLGFLPADGQGAFQGGATGAPIQEAVLVALSLVLFVAAYRRGAFPRLAGLLGWSPEPPARGPREAPSRRPTLDRLVQVRRGETQLTLRILRVRLRSILPQADSAQRHRERTVERLRQARDDLRREAESLEEELSRARFGGSA